MHAKSLQSCLMLCDPMDHSPAGPSVHGILQARILEWVAMPFSRGSSQPGDRTRVSYVSCIDRQVPYPLALSWEVQFQVYSKAIRSFSIISYSVQFSSVAGSCPTLCNPMVLHSELGRWLWTLEAGCQSNCLFFQNFIFISKQFQIF